MPVSTAKAGDEVPAPSWRGIWKVASVAILGSFISQLDATIVNLSLPVLTRTFHSSLHFIHWVISGYLLALALILPLNGWLVDRIGAKQVYIWCFAAFTLASALCGLAWSAPSLIGFRVLQGLSGGLLAPMTQMMMARIAGPKLAQVVGFSAMPVLLAPILGPVAAGAILQYASWRWLFLINVPVGIAAIVIALAFLPADRDTVRRRSLDAVGLALLSPGLVALLYAFDRLPGAAGMVPLAIATVLLTGFLVWIQRRGRMALINPMLFADRAFSTAVGVQFLSNGVGFTGQLLLPVFLMQACGQQPAQIGFLLAPQGLGMMCGYPSMGYLTDRFGVRPVSCTGALLALFATLALTWIGSRDLVNWAFMLALFVRGMGLSAIGVPSVSAAYAAVARDDLPMASTAINVIQRLGGPALTTVMSAFLAWRSATIPWGTSHSIYVEAFLLLAAFHMAMVVMALQLPWKIGSGPDVRGAETRIECDVPG